MILGNNIDENCKEGDIMKRNILLAVMGLLILAAILMIRMQGENVAGPTLTPPPEAEVLDTAAPLLPPETFPTAVPPRVIQERLQPLIAQNKDLIGWIKMPNTQVDNPVMKSRDNDYYLHRDFNRKNAYAGTLFMDYRNIGDGTDRHTIIYGHNMKDGSMFGTLKQYKKRAFYDANRRFTLSTLYEDTEWEIFAAYISPPTLDLIPTDFTDDQAFLDFVAFRQRKSAYPNEVDILPTDKILTLITCTYEIRDGRYVIHARRVD